MKGKMASSEESSEGSNPQLGVVESAGSSTAATTTTTVIVSTGPLLTSTRTTALNADIYDHEDTTAQNSVENAPPSTQASQSPRSEITRAPAGTSTTTTATAAQSSPVVPEAMPEEPTMRPTGSSYPATGNSDTTPPQAPIPGNASTSMLAPELWLLDIPNVKLSGEVGNYEFKKSLGRGSFGHVVQAVHCPTKMKVAIKIVDKEALRVGEKQLLEGEVAAMMLVDHPNVIRLFEIIETPKHTCLVMEYCPGGDLTCVVGQKMTEKAALALFRPLVTAIGYCHNLGVAHRDLKLDNLLLDESDNIKLADFGFGIKLTPDSVEGFTRDTPKLDSTCGSPSYMAPEIFREEQYDSFKVDMWSLGVILVVLLTGKFPFHGKTIEKLQEAVLAGKYTLPSSISNDASVLVRQLLSLDPAQRATVDDVRNSAWVLGGGPMPWTRALPHNTSPKYYDAEILLLMAEKGPTMEEIMHDLATGKGFCSTAATHHLLCASRAVNPTKYQEEYLAVEDNSGFGGSSSSGLFNSLLHQTTTGQSAWSPSVSSSPSTSRSSSPSPTGALRRAQKKTSSTQTTSTNNMRRSPATPRRALSGRDHPAIPEYGSALPTSPSTVIVRPRKLFFPRGVRTASRLAPNEILLCLRAQLGRKGGTATEMLSPFRLSCDLPGSECRWEMEVCWARLRQKHVVTCKKTLGKDKAYEDTLAVFFANARL